MWYLCDTNMLIVIIKIKNKHTRARVQAKSASSCIGDDDDGDDKDADVCWCVVLWNKYYCDDTMCLNPYLADFDVTVNSGVVHK